MTLPCEIFVQKILPCIRRELAFLMYRKYNMSQTEIARKLNISQAAVSQYLSGNRAKYYVNLDENSMKIIEELAEKLCYEYNDLKSSRDYLCKLCSIILRDNCERANF